MKLIDVFDGFLEGVRAISGVIFMFCWFLVLLQADREEQKKERKFDEELSKMRKRNQTR